MILKINEQEYELRLPCKNFRKLKEKLNGELMDTLMTAMQNSDVDVMADAFSVLCTEANFKRDNAYDVIDAFLAEEGNTVTAFGIRILEVLDQAGFLPQKGMAAKVSRMMDKQLAGMMQELEEATQEETKPFKGHKA